MGEHHGAGVRGRLVARSGCVPRLVRSSGPSREQEKFSTGKLFYAGRSGLRRVRPTGQTGVLTTMVRKAFRMVVDPGQHAEYERRHRPVWRELEEVLRDHGVGSYSIFLDDSTGDLFGYVEVEDEARWDAIASTDVCRRWWRFMRDIMPSTADDRPVSRDLREVFHLDAGPRERS